MEKWVRMRKKNNSLKLCTTCIIQVYVCPSKIMGPYDEICSIFISFVHDQAVSRLLMVSREIKRSTSK